MPNTVTSPSVLSLGSSQEQLDLIYLVAADAMPPSWLLRVIQAAGAPRRVIEGSPALLAEASGVGADRIARLIERTRDERLRLQAARDRKLCADRGIRLIGLDDLDYPPLLKATPEPPLLLWVWGESDPSDVYAASVLGSSKHSGYGAKQARRFAAALSEHGVTLVNSGEVGIDTHAIDAALEACGRVVVALGAGLFAHGRDSRQDALYRRIVESGRGAVVSSVPVTTPPDTTNQVMGDYLVAGLAMGLLLVEAGAQSGALIAARVARQQIRREVFALPGRIQDPLAEGNLRLIAEQSALLVTAPEDLLDQLVNASQTLSHYIARSQPSLQLRGRPSVSRDALRVPLEEPDHKVLDHFIDSISAGEIANRIGQPVRGVQTLLYRLALSGAMSKSGPRYRWVDDD
ncbi:MAG: DNA-processing protein DprA [Planctomycetota bacterium]